MKRAWYLLLPIIAPLAWIGCDGTTKTNSSGAKSTADLIAAGDAALAKNDFDGAFAAFDNAVGSDPDSAQARQRRGQAYLCLGKSERAVEDCTAALNIDGKLTNAFFTRGQAEKNLGQTEKAGEDFSHALDLNPDRADIAAARGAMFQQMAAAAADREKGRKLLDSALKDFDRALKLDHREAAVLMHRAEILLETGDYQAAIDDCDKALEIDPDMAHVRITRASAFIEKGEVDNAIADCDTSIRADEKQPEAYVVRAKARLARALEMRTPAAVAACGQAADDCRTAIALGGLVQGDAETLKRARKWTAAAHDLRGLLYDRLQAEKKASGEYASALALDSSLADALIHRALNRANGKDFAGAVSDCNVAIEIDSGRPEGYYGRGEVYRIKRQYPEAIKDFQEAVARKYAKAYGGLALVYFTLADVERLKAQALLRKRTENQSVEYAAGMKKGLEYSQQCVDNATRALEANRHQPELYIRRGLAHANSRNLPQAFSDLSAAIGEDPLAAKAYFLRAVVLVNASHLDDAIKDFTKAIELQPNYAIAYKRRGEVYKALGDPVSAAADGQKYKELVARLKQELSSSVDRPDESFGKAEEPSLAAELGPAFQPLVKAKKELEAKLDASAVK
jgi:tetratricopeptide (TPR) repeat protein